MQFGRRRFLQALGAGTLLVVADPVTKKAEALAAVVNAVTAKAVKLQPGGTAFAAYFNSDVAEIIVYNRALTDTERNTIENYLYKKWIEPGDLKVRLETQGIM